MEPNVNLFPKTQCCFILYTLEKLLSWIFSAYLIKVFIKFYCLLPDDIVQLINFYVMRIVCKIIKSVIVLCNEHPVHKHCTDDLWQSRWKLTWLLMKILMFCYSSLWCQALVQRPFSYGHYGSLSTTVKVRRHLLVKFHGLSDGTVQ